MNIRTAARRVRRTFDSHQPLVQVSISQENLLHNLHTYQQKYPDLKFAPVLKSNAYGHGLAVVAKILDKEDIAFFMVDSFYEARVLRRDGIRSKILIMGYVQPNEITGTTLTNTEHTIVDFEQLRELVTIARKPVRLHIKIDTGMHRQGITPAQIPEAISLLHSNKCIKIVGIASHLADADNPNPEHTLTQLSVWNDAVQKFTSEFPSIECRHIAATKGIPMSAKASANVARLGIGLYGFDTSPEGSTDLKPVLEMRSLVTSVRDVPGGDSIGYNATYTPTSAARIATVPVGYFEGVDRRLSNKGCMLVGGSVCPIAGRVSMNMSCLDVTNAPDVIQGNQVTVISRNREDQNSVENIVKTIQTHEFKDTEYVILTHIPAHLKRVVE